MQTQEVAVTLDSTEWAHETHVRSAGAHLSHIIHDISETHYHLTKPDMASNDLEAYRIGGFLFERALYDLMLVNDVVERIGEIEVDGIIMTPDAVNLSRSRGIESKCTWRSMKHDVMDQTGEFAEWWMQMLGYAKGLDMKSWDLWVFFINGDYGKNRRPKIRHWEIEFEQEEVDQNWRRITNHYQWMKEAGRIK